MVVVVSYESLRTSAKTSLAEQAGLARMYVGKLQTAQRAAEKALDMSFCFFGASSDIGEITYVLRQVSKEMWRRVIRYDAAQSRELQEVC